MRIYLVILLAIAMVGGSCTKTSTTPNSVLIYGHGGLGFDVTNSAYAPNTVPSFELALDVYELDGIEIDLQYTQDGQLIVFHDDFLEKSTECKGRINDVSLDSACSCRYRKQFGNQYENRVISFDSFLRLYSEKWKDKRVSLNIQGSFSIQFSIDTLASNFVNILRKYNIGEYASVECGSTYFLKKIKEYDSTRLCYAVGKQRKIVVQEILDLDLDGIVSRFTETNDSLKQVLISNGKHITLYGIKLQKDYKNTNWEGVRSMQTDNPVLSLKYFGRD